MSFKFTGVPKLKDSNPKTHFKQPGTGDSFEWWAEAQPGPAYVMCVIRIEKFVDANTLQCWFLNPLTGKEFTTQEIPAQPITVDLTNRTHVWRKLPSVVDLPDANTPTANHATLFLTDEWLRANATALFDVLDANPGLRAKYPVGEDGLLIETIKELMRGLEAANKDLSVFPTLKQLQKRLPWLRL